MNASYVAGGNKRITVDVFIDRDGIPFDGEIVHDVMSRVGEFYGGMGREHGLPGVDMEFEYRDGLPDDIRQYTKDHQVIMFSTMDRIFGNMSPEDIVYMHGFEERANEFVREAFKASSDPEADKRLVCEYLSSEVLSRESGSNFGDKDSHAACMNMTSGIGDYPADILKKGLPIIAAHELGHVNGLEHVDGEPNLMNKQSFRMALNSDQVTDIHEFLSGE